MLLRDEIKYVRDYAKSDYDKAPSCRICGSTENLQLHHFNSMTKLWNKWKKDNGIVINNVDDIEKYRVLFVNTFYTEVYHEIVTLCKFHHMDKLHKVYGISPALYTADKQKRWVEIQRNKHNV